MALSSNDGPNYAYGNMASIPLAIAGNTAVLDYNLDAGPNGEFQGDGLLDMRFLFKKDKLQGYTGKQPMHFSMAYLMSVNQIPAAASATNIVTGANVVNGTAMTLNGASLGVTPNVPIVPIGYEWNGNAVVTALALDFGAFEFANCTAGNPLVTVANTNDFVVGMPLVIGNVGNAGGTVPLLTFVSAINSLTTLTLANAPLATNATAPVGLGNIWGPAEDVYNAANATPTAHQPFIAGGPGLLLDPRQAIARGLRVTGVAGGTGGAFAVTGFDVYGMPMHETITATAGATTVYGVKAWKYITSIVPQFTDAHNYSFGTSDVFGLHYRASSWENTDICWNATYMNTSTGFTAPPSLGSTATATSADVRGTIQTSTQGGGTGIGSTNSNGTVSGLQMSGVRLMMAQMIPVYDAVRAFPGSLTANPSAIATPNPNSMFGIIQF